MSLLPKNTVEQAKSLARLMELVALANAVQCAREYNFTYFRGKWICIYYFDIEAGRETYIVEKDTRMTDENIKKALRAMEKEIQKCTRGREKKSEVSE